MGAKTGKDLKLYYKVGGVASSLGTWTELTAARDVTLNVEKTQADASSRGTGGWKANVNGLKDGSVDFQLVWDHDDAGFQALMDAFDADTVMGLAILDEAQATGTGLVADFNIAKFARNEPLDDVVTADVSAKIAYSATAPDWMDNGQPALT